jgi:PD-(D/E)XK nuclease superfamily
VSKIADTSALAKIEIPSKYDVIPIHNSDRATFKACRRKWDWSSPARQNLTVRADVAGIYQPFFFGTGIHYALENYYTPMSSIRRDPVESFKTWFDIMWTGGTVTAEWLDRVYDLNPQPHDRAVNYASGGIDDDPSSYTDSDGPVLTWTVRGLRDIVPEIDEYEFMEIRELGIAMLENYKRYAAENDGFEVISVEHDFSVPIWDYDNDCILMAVDMREQSPNYGKKLEVHSRGRMDMQTIKPNGKLGIVDHKTVEKMEAELDAKLETDEQITTYLWAAEVEASYYDLPHKGQPFEEVIYNVIRKAAPKPPTIVRGGLFSVDRNNESCTYDLIKQWMDSANISYSELDEKHQGYVDWLRKIGDEQFFVRKLVRRNRHQLRNAGYRIYQETLDMLDVAMRPTHKIYPNFRKDWSCLNCQFRAPCLAIESGEDWQYLIRENYTTTKDR